MSCQVAKLDRLKLTPEIQTSIDAIYNQILSLVKSQGKSFSVSDIYNMITATTVAVNSFFKDTDTPTKITYVGEIVLQVIENLSISGVIPSEIGFIVKFIPVQSIVELVMKMIDKPPSQPAAEPKHVLKMLSVKHHTGIEDL